MNRDVTFRKLFLRIFLCSVVSLCLFGGLFIGSYQKLMQVSNQTIESLVAEIRISYPNVSDEEILEILNHPQHSSFFSDYGIDLEDTFAIENLRQQQRNLMLCFILAWFLVFGAIFYFLIWYVKRNRLEIQKIVSLLDDINHKIYAISLEEETEGMYSILRNELYKTIILLKEQAENAEIEKQALKTALSDISHQIKTPLTSILIMLDTITDYPDMSCELEMEFLEDIRSQIQRIHFLTMTLLKLARIESGVVQFKEDKIQGKELIDTVLANLDVLAVSKNISFVLDGSLHFYGDFQFLEEAFMNILKNSIEASYRNGKIFIHMEENPLYSKFVIRDEGIGIDDKEVSHIFDRFFKSKNATSDNIGIGLNLSRKIIEGNGGTISCYSELGKGTSFEIKFIKAR